MQWFQHDSDATQDAKIKKLLIRHKALGYAIYFHCLELISAEVSESNLTFELDHDAEIIASNLFVEGTAGKSGIQVVEEVMRTIIELGLFNESNGHIFCMKLLKRINLSMTSNPSFRVAIGKKKEEYHDTVMMRHDTIMLPTLPTNQPTLPTKAKREKKVFIPPTLEQVKEYCIEKEYSINEKVFFDHYDSLDWKDKEGNQVQNWKNKVVNWASKEYNQVAPIPKPSSLNSRNCPACGGEIFNSICRKCGIMMDAKGEILT